MNPLYIPPSCLLHALMWPQMVGWYLRLVFTLLSPLLTLRTFLLLLSVVLSLRLHAHACTCSPMPSLSFFLRFLRSVCHSSFRAPSSASCFPPVLHDTFWAHTFLVQFQKPQYFPCAKLCRSDTCWVSTGRFALTNGVATEIFLFLLAHKKSIYATILGAALCLRHCFGNVKLIV